MADDVDRALADAKAELARLQEKVTSHCRVVDEQVLSIKELMRERGRRYDDRNEIQDRERTESITKIEDAIRRNEDLARQQAHEIQAQFRGILDRINGLAELVHDVTTRGTGMRELWGYLVGGLGVLAAILTVVYMHR